MRHLRIVALAVVLALPVAAQDFEKGLEAYQRGDYETALREFRPLAEQGYAEAQYSLGLMYENGLGVPRSYAMAHKWFTLGAALWPGSKASKQNDMALEARFKLFKLMTPDQFAEAERLVREKMAKYGK